MIKKILMLSAACTFLAAYTEQLDRPYVIINDDLVHTQEHSRSLINNVALIARDQLATYAQNFAQKYLTLTHDMPTRDLEATHTVINTTMQNISSVITQELIKKNMNFVDQKKVDSLLKASLMKIGHQLPHAYAPTTQLTKLIDQNISSFFTSKQQSLSHIPKEMKVEFTQHRAKLITKMANIMRKRKTNSLPQEEVTNHIIRVFEDFSTRMFLVNQRHSINEQLIFLNDPNNKHTPCSSIPRGKSIN